MRSRSSGRPGRAVAGGRTQRVLRDAPRTWREALRRRRAFRRRNRRPTAPPSSAWPAACGCSRAAPCRPRARPVDRAPRRTLSRAVRQLARPHRADRAAAPSAPGRCASGRDARARRPRRCARSAASRARSGRPHRRARCATRRRRARRRAPSSPSRIDVADPRRDSSFCACSISACAIEARTS